MLKALRFFGYMKIIFVPLQLERAFFGFV